MHPVNGGLRNALNEVVFAPNHVTLAAHKRNCGYEFSAISLTSLNRIERELGIGYAAPRCVARALLDCKNELMSIGEQWWNAREKNKLILADRFITQIFIEAKIPEKAIDLFKGRYESWMKDLPAELKSKKINQIIFPSTHDSGAYNIDWNHPITDNMLSMLCRMIPFVRHIIKSWGITQPGNTESQLEEGKRGFDWRISYDQTTKQFYLSHAFACDPLKDALVAIKTFLNKHPSEVVVLTMRPDWYNRHGFYPHIKEFKQLVEDELKDLLFPPTQTLELPTFNDIVEEKKNIIAIWDNHVNVNSSFIWGHHTFQDHWCNSSNLQTKLTYLENLLNHIPTNSNSFLNFSITLTPQTNDVVISVLERIFMPWMKPRSLETLTRSIQDASQKFFTNPIYSDKLQETSVISTDFPYHSFVHQVVELNYQKASKIKNDLVLKDKSQPISDLNSAVVSS